MTRRVHKTTPSQRAQDAENGQGIFYRNKPLSGISEPGGGDGMTGAPVTELEYKRYFDADAVLDEVNMATY